VPNWVILENYNSSRRVLIPMLSLSARIEKRAGAGNSEEPLVLMGHRASPKPDTGTCEIGIESQEHEDYDRVLLFMCRFIFEGDILKMITLTGVTSLSSRNPPKRFSGGTMVVGSVG